MTTQPSVNATGSRPVKRIALALLVAFVLLGANAPAEADAVDDLVEVTCEGVADDNDADDDHLSDCLESYLHTAMVNPDGDADNISDGLDLLPETPAEFFELPVSITQFKEGGKKCDPPGGRYWDPIISVGFVNLPDYVSGTNQQNFLKEGYTEGKHKHGKRTHEPATLEVVLTAPQDVSLYQRGGLLDFPLANLAFGLADHDVTDAGTHGVSPSLDETLPIVQLKNGAYLTATYEGGGDCRALIEVVVKSPVSLEQMVAAVRVASGVEIVAAKDVIPAAAEAETSLAMLGILPAELSQYALGGQEGLLYEANALAEESMVFVEEHHIYHTLPMAPLPGPCAILTGVVGNPAVVDDSAALTTLSTSIYRATSTFTAGTTTIVRTLVFTGSGSDKWITGTSPIEVPDGLCAIPDSTLEVELYDVTASQQLMVTQFPVTIGVDPLPHYLVVTSSNGPSTNPPGDTKDHRVKTSWDSDPADNFWAVWDVTPSAD